LDYLGNHEIPARGFIEYLRAYYGFLTIKFSIKTVITACKRSGQSWPTRLLRVWLLPFVFKWLLLGPGAVLRFPEGVCGGKGKGFIFFGNFLTTRFL
jgi:hypothetical protein